jgi:hypothetical protein
MSALRTVNIAILKSEADSSLPAKPWKASKPNASSQIPLTP